MYQNEYIRMNEQINPSENLADRILQNTAPRRRITLRPMAAVAALLVLVLAATPVMAECVPWILERIAPELAQRLQPVQRSDTNNGITMEVVAASVKGFKAELVVKIEGEALKEPVGVAPHLHSNWDGLKSGSIYPLVGYDGMEEDENGGIYYYQVIMNYEKGISLEKLLDGEITVTLGGIMTNTPATEETEIPIILTDAEDIALRRVTDLEKQGYCTGWSDSPKYPHGCSLGAYVMQTSGKTACDVTEDLSLMAASYIDGLLHVQLRARNTHDRYGNYVWDYLGPWLTDGEGNQVKRVYCNFFNTAPGEMRVAYAEYVFDIPPEKLEDYTLSVRLETIQTLRADCEVTFQFTEDEIITE